MNANKTKVLSTTGYHSVFVRINRPALKAEHFADLGSIVSTDGSTELNLALTAIDKHLRLCLKSENEVISDCHILSSTWEVIAAFTQKLQTFVNISV